MHTETDINRFIEAQDIPYFSGYQQALKEITAGKKVNHWVWYIFPQLRGLGISERSWYFGITGRTEAAEYLNHPVLGPRMRQITEALLSHSGLEAKVILGNTDALKVRSCMTLFDMISPHDIFAQVLEVFYHNQRCHKTLIALQEVSDDNRER